MAAIERRKSKARQHGGHLMLIRANPEQPVNITYVTQEEAGRVFKDVRAEMSLRY